MLNRCPMVNPDEGRCRSVALVVGRDCGTGRDLSADTGGTHRVGPRLLSIELRGVYIAS